MLHTIFYEAIESGELALIRHTSYKSLSQINRSKVRMQTLLYPINIWVETEYRVWTYNSSIGKSYYLLDGYLSEDNISKNSENPSLIMYIENSFVERYPQYKDHPHIIFSDIEDRDYRLLAIRMRCEELGMDFMPPPHRN